MKRYFVLLLFSLFTVFSFSQTRDTSTVTIVSGCRDGIPTQLIFDLYESDGSTFVEQLVVNNPTGGSISSPNGYIEFLSLKDYDSTSGVPNQLYAIVSADIDAGKILTHKVQFSCSGGIYQAIAYSSKFLDSKPIDVDTYYNIIGVSQRDSINGSLTTYTIRSIDETGNVSTSTFADENSIIVTANTPGIDALGNSFNIGNKLIKLSSGDSIFVSKTEVSATVATNILGKDSVTLVVDGVVYDWNDTDTKSTITGVTSVESADGSVTTYTVSSEDESGNVSTTNFTDNNTITVTATVAGVDAAGNAYGIGDELIRLPSGDFISAEKATVTVNKLTNIAGLDSVELVVNGSIIATFVDTDTDTNTFANGITATVAGTDAAGNAYSIGDALIELPNGDVYSAEKTIVSANQLTSVNGLDSFELVVEGQVVGGFVDTNSDCGVTTLTGTIVGTNVAADGTETTTRSHTYTNDCGTFTVVDIDSRTPATTSSFSDATTATGITTTHNNGNGDSHVTRIDTTQNADGTTTISYSIGGNSLSVSACTDCPQLDSLHQAVIYITNTDGDTTGFTITKTNNDGTTSDVTVDLPIQISSYRDTVIRGDSLGLIKDVGDTTWIDNIINEQVIEYNLVGKADTTKLLRDNGTFDCIVDKEFFVQKTCDTIIYIFTKEDCLGNELDRDSIIEVSKSLLPVVTTLSHNATNNATYNNFTLTSVVTNTVSGVSTYTFDVPDKADYIELEGAYGAAPPTQITEYINGIASTLTLPTDNQYLLDKYDIDFSNLGGTMGQSLTGLAKGYNNCYYPIVNMSLQVTNECNQVSKKKSVKIFCRYATRELYVLQGYRPDPAGGSRGANVNGSTFTYANDREEMPFASALISQSLEIDWWEFDINGYTIANGLPTDVINVYIGDWNPYIDSIQGTIESPIFLYKNDGSENGMVNGSASYFNINTRINVRDTICNKQFILFMTQDMAKVAGTGGDTGLNAPTSSNYAFIYNDQTFATDQWRIFNRSLATNWLGVQNIVDPHEIIPNSSYVEFLPTAYTYHSEFLQAEQEGESNLSLFDWTKQDRADNNHIIHRVRSKSLRTLEGTGVDNYADAFIKHIFH